MKWKGSSMVKGFSLIKNYFPPLLLFLFFFLLWETGVSLFSIPAYILPAPHKIFTLLLRNWSLFLHHTLVTLKEVLLGFIFAFFWGISTALLIFYSKLMERTLYPIVIASQTIPVFAIAPLLILWFGYGVAPKVIMAAIIVYFPIVVNTVDGLRSVDPDAVNLLRILGAGEREILFKVRVPSMLPFLFSGTKIGISVSVIGAVIGEWVGATEGLGYLMIHANAQLRVDILFTAIIVLSLMAVLLFGIVRFIEYISLPWKRLEVKGGLK
jgi:ABC-type nitrate/sulfonate/bicarbonate transport system permease component